MDVAIRPGLESAFLFMDGGASQCVHWIGAVEGWSYYDWTLYNERKRVIGSGQADIDIRTLGPEPNYLNTLEQLSWSLLLASRNIRYGYEHDEGAKWQPYTAAWLDVHFDGLEMAHHSMVLQRPYLIPSAIDTLRVELAGTSSCSSIGALDRAWAWSAGIYLDDCIGPS